MTDVHVIMTALPPTTGHADLIRFANAYARDNGGDVYVHLTICRDEPFINERVFALDEFINNHLNTDYTSSTEVNLVTDYYDVDMPQTPEEYDGNELEFWDMWCEFLFYSEWSEMWTGEYASPHSVIIGSEKYCQNLADCMGWDFVEYDMDRSSNSIRATVVRESPLIYMPKFALPEFISGVNHRFVFIGAESVGKTTVSKSVAKYIMHAKWYAEWARPYLERTGSHLDNQKMDMIARAQTAIDRVVKGSSDLISIQDTDIMATIGYYRLYDELHTDLYRDIESQQQLLSSMYHMTKGETLGGGAPKRFSVAKNATYIVLQQDHVPFEVDPLRYGGSVRETEDQYWIDLLEEFNKDYVVCPALDIAGTIEWCENLIYSKMRAKLAPMSTYQRRS